MNKNAWKCKRWGHYFKGRLIAYTEVNRKDCGTPGFADALVRCSRCDRYHTINIVVDLALGVTSLMSKHTQKLRDAITAPNYLFTLLSKDEK